jgi:putative transposase
MVRSGARKQGVRNLVSGQFASERRACILLGVTRSAYRRPSCRVDDVKLRKRLIELAGERKRFGYRRLHTLLRWEAYPVNVKRVYRLYKEEGLTVRKRNRKRLKGSPRKELRVAGRPNEQWAMDFTSDSLADGRSIRTLNVVDTYTTEGHLHDLYRIYPLPSSTFAVSNLSCRLTIRAERGLWKPWASSPSKYPFVAPGRMELWNA